MDRRCVYVADSALAPVITSRNHRGTDPPPHPSHNPTDTAAHTQHAAVPTLDRAPAQPRPPTHTPSSADSLLSLPHARTRSSLFSKQIISHSLSLSAATLEHTHVALHQNHSKRSSALSQTSVTSTEHSFTSRQSISRQFDLDSLGRHLSTAGLLLFVVVRGADAAADAAAPD